MSTHYDAFLLDLDGTVYRGGEVIPGAPQAIADARDNGVAIRFVTNNASRPPRVVAQHLTELGVQAADAEVNTSAQAAATVLAQRLPANATVLVVGADSLADEVAARGLKPVWDNDVPVDAVVQGLSKDTGWRQLAEACVAINSGAQWVACNVDPTLPTERGFLPGNGSLVGALKIATGVEPDIAGKPAAPLMNEAIAAANARNPLVVGDRLDTDIAGAAEVGVDALLVLTGVSGVRELLDAPEKLRPKYVGADLSALACAPEDLVFGPRAQWTITVDGEVAEVAGDGDRLDLVRALCARVWSAGRVPATFLAATAQAADALTELGLTVTSA